jgi:hypothetical protein
MHLACTFNTRASKGCKNIVVREAQGSTPCRGEEHETDAVVPANAASSEDLPPTSGASAVQQHEGEAGQATSESADLQTAFVEDMLATDPVVALGLRIASRGPITLEYVSIDEARADLSALVVLLHNAINIAAFYC